MALSTEEIKNLPTYTEKAKASAGKDVLLYVCEQDSPRQWVLIGGQQNAPLTEQADSIDVSDKTSNFGKKLAGLHNWSIDFSGLWVMGDEGLAICRYLYSHDKPGYFRLEYPNGTYRQGWASITEMSDDNAHDAALTVKMTIEGYAELSDFVDPDAPTIETTTVTATDDGATFTLSKADVPIRSLKTSDGRVLLYGEDYTLIGTSLTLAATYTDTLTEETALIAVFAKSSIDLIVKPKAS